MVDSSVDQVDILRTFPNYTWRALQERYAYNFGDGHWPKAYAGKRRYNRDTRWENTAEYQAEQETAQLTVNGLSFDRCK